MSGPINNANHVFHEGKGGPAKDGKGMSMDHNVGLEDKTGSYFNPVSDSVKTAENIKMSMVLNGEIPGMHVNVTGLTNFAGREKL